MSRRQDRSRRAFIHTAGAASAGLLLGPAIAGCSSTETVPHPRIYVSSHCRKGLKTIDDLRTAIQSGHSQSLYSKLKARGESELGKDPLLPTTPLPGRSPASTRHGNRDFYICREAGRRILTGSLLALINEDNRFVSTVLGQMQALFDESRWIAWIDDAHVHFGHPAGLRTGMLARDVALAYDWVYPLLSEAEKAFVIEGLDRMGIQPYLQSLKQSPWWMRDLNNWMTTIVGGLGIAGMVLSDEHPDSRRLVELGLENMDRYLSIYGSQGEFNESVAYANATNRPVGFFEAYRYHTLGARNRLSESPFPETCRWIMHLTLPPGRVAAFGDAHTDARPWVEHFAPIASASRDGVIQWFYEQHANPADANPLALAWYDPSVSALSARGQLPLGRAFTAHGGCFVSRTSWDQKSAICVVYGKAGREENHEHNDLGQVCIDGYGDRLIVDLGSPSHYPADFFEDERWEYYNASIRGHNVLMFGGREMRVPRRKRGESVADKIPPINGRILRSEFADGRGGFVVMDTTNAYDGAVAVQRTVVHLMPGVVAVLDEAILNVEQQISLRWHVANEPDLGRNGAFSVTTPRAQLHACVTNVSDGSLSVSVGHHRYEAPFDHGRDGDLLRQRNEPYVEAALCGKTCRILSLFSVGSISGEKKPWVSSDDTWSVKTADGIVRVQIHADRLVVSGEDPVHTWNVELPGSDER